MAFHIDEYKAAPDRYDAGMPFRRTGRSGLDLPAISLGLWHNFGDDVPMERQRAILRRAFDRGVTHFDLANNYGPEYGAAERNFGAHLRRDFGIYRDELIISSKAGWDMWPGPYGQGGGSRKYVIASAEQSLKRMGLDYVDIFYSHRFDETTPLEETMGALDALVRQGKALYVGKGTCINCHGAEGDGNGPVAAQLNPAPRNFQHHGFWRHRTEGEIFWVIKHGSPGTSMIGFADQLTDEDIWAIIHYERTFRRHHGMRGRGPMGQGGMRDTHDRDHMDQSDEEPAAPQSSQPPDKE